jgi:hypothetical protein
MIKAWPDSSTVKTTSFDDSLNRLEIEFKNGGRYQYEGFTQEDWNRLIAAESIGSFIHRNIRGKFPYTKISQ